MRERRSPSPPRALQGALCSICAALGVAFALEAEAATRRPLNLYEWMAVAPNVVAGEVVADDEKLVEVEVLATCRGAIAPGSRIRVDLRRTNRDREQGTPALELQKDRSYLLLLAPPPEIRPGKPWGYALVRGTAGARPLPQEGADLWIDAAKRLCAAATANDDDLLWQELGEALSEGNPVMVATALEMHIKFLRGGLGLLPRLRDLIADRRPEVRAQAAELAGQILARNDWASDPSGEASVADLIGMARRDPDVDARVRATLALGSIPGAKITEALREIAREDPEQSVRYAAERSIFERSGRPPTPSGAPHASD